MKTFRLRDILEIHPAERRLELQNEIDQFIGIFRVDANRERVDAAEIFEQDRFSFHDRHPGFGADVAESEHAGSVGDDRDKIRLIRVLKNQVGIVVDGHARFRDAGRVPDGEIVEIPDAAFRRDFDFAAVERMHLHRVLSGLFGLVDEVLFVESGCHEKLRVDATNEVDGTPMVGGGQGRGRSLH